MEITEESSTPYSPSHRTVARLRQINVTTEVKSMETFQIVVWAIIMIVIIYLAIRCYKEGNK